MGNSRDTRIASFLWLFRKKHSVEDCENIARSLALLLERSRVSWLKAGKKMNNNSEKYIPVDIKRMVGNSYIFWEFRNYIFGDQVWRSYQNDFSASKIVTGDVWRARDFKSICFQYGFELVSIDKSDHAITSEFHQSYAKRMVFKAIA